MRVPRSAAISGSSFIVGLPKKIFECFSYIVAQRLYLPHLVVPLDPLHVPLDSNSEGVGLLLNHDFGRLGGGGRAGDGDLRGDVTVVNAVLAGESVALLADLGDVHLRAS